MSGTLLFDCVNQASSYWENFMTKCWVISGPPFGTFVLVHEGSRIKQSHMLAGLPFTLSIMEIDRMFSEISPGKDF